MPHEFGKQFRWRKFKLNYGYPDDFVLHQWQETTSVEGLFMLYRFFFLALFTVTLYVILRQSLWDNVLTWKRCIYFSNWTLCMCWVNSFLGCVLVIYNYAFQCEQNTETYLNDMPVLTKLYWIANTIALDCSISVAICYWGALVVWLDAYMNLGSKLWHTMMPLYMFLDFWINSIPIRILHIYIVFIYIFIYISFSIVYQLIFRGTSIEGYEAIYPFLDWRQNPLKALVYIVISCLTAVCIRFLMYGMHRLKNSISKWLFNEDGRQFDNGRSFSSRDDSLSNLAVLRH